MASLSQVAYCSADDVKQRIYQGMGSTVPPPDDAFTTYLDEMAHDHSRKFDQETGRPLNGFAVTFEARVFSGKGGQLLDLDEFVAIQKVEWNNNPIGVPNWIDLTAELGTGNMVIRPLRFYPKRQFWRQQTFIVDPYGNGNYRITGVWGVLQPEMSLAPPTGQTPAWNSLTDAQIQAIAPNPALAPPACGWWQTPANVKVAVSQWSAYTYRADQASYADQAGHPGGTGALFTKGIPPPVAETIALYRGGKSKLALVGIDGSIAGAADQPDRWAGWHWFDPTNGTSW